MRSMLKTELRHNIAASLANIWSQDRLAKCWADQGHFDLAAAADAASDILQGHLAIVLDVLDDLRRCE